MKKIDFYTCEICGTQYKKKMECQKCEKSHIKAERITGCQYMPKICNGGYPVNITVEMADGKDITYRQMGRT